MVMWIIWSVLLSLVDITYKQMSNFLPISGWASPTGSDIDSFRIMQSIFQMTLTIVIDQTG